jgi:hypothetical protein
LLFSQFSGNAPLLFFSSTGLGLCSGIVLYTGAQWAKKLGFLKHAKLNPNTGMLTILGSFAFGTFFMASTTGKELVHLLHPVFRTGWVEPEHNLTLPKLNYEGTRSKQMLVDPQQLREMRVTRRKSLMDTLTQGGRGISDSHSGRWVEENSETRFEKG